MNEHVKFCVTRRYFKCYLPATAERHLLNGTACTPIREKHECNCGQITGSSSSVHSRYMEAKEMLNYFKKEKCINQIKNKRRDSVPALGIY